MTGEIDSSTFLAVEEQATRLAQELERLAGVVKRYQAAAESLENAATDSVTWVKLRRRQPNRSET